MMYSDLLLTVQTKNAIRIYNEIQCMAKNNARRLGSRTYVCMNRDYSEAVGTLVATNIEGAILSAAEAVARRARRSRSRSRTVRLNRINNLLNQSGITFPTLPNFGGLVNFRTTTRNFQDETASSSFDDDRNEQTAYEKSAFEREQATENYEGTRYLRRWATATEDEFRAEKTSPCCPLCPEFYFPYTNSQLRSCSRVTTISLCCPLACQSTRALGIGVGMSPHVCCIRVKNEKCQFQRV